MTFYLKYCERENLRDATGKHPAMQQILVKQNRSFLLKVSEDTLVNTDRNKMTSGAYRRKSSVND